MVVIAEQVLGWEDFDPTYFPGPADVVPAPPLFPAPLSLLTACPIRDTGAGANNMPPDNDRPPALLGPAWERWAQGFQFLPEEVGPAGGFAWCSDVPLPESNNCPGKAIVNVFVAVELDDRSTAGFKANDAMDRVVRALLAHEAWVVENQWWTGAFNEANAHLNAASPIYPAAFQAGKTAYDSVGLSASLGLLEQSIAFRDAGMGIIHCTPYVFQAWATRGGIPFRYDGATPMTSSHIWTPNGNLVVPGYGYDGSGPADAPAIDDPQWQTEQWAYATDMVFLLRGEVQREPNSLEDMAPAIQQFNDIPWRAIRPWAIYSNGGLRSAVLVDTTTP